MFKLNQLIVGIFLFLSSLFSCQQKGDFQSMNVEEFDSLIQNEDIQRLDVRTLAEYSEGHITKTININVMDDSFASMADSLLQKDTETLGLSFPHPPVPESAFHPSYLCLL